MTTAYIPDQPFLADAPPPGAVRPGDGLDWLEARRAESLDHFRAQGVPTQRLEDWKYTRLRPLDDTRFRAARPQDGALEIDAVPSVFPDDGPAPHRFVFVDGQMRADLTRAAGLPAGVVAGALADVLRDDPDAVRPHLDAAAPAGAALADLNMALMDSGFVLIVPDGVAVERPIEIVYIGGTVDDPVAYFPRNLIVLGRGADATVIKHHVGRGGAYFANAVTDVAVGPNARLRHVKVQADSRDATHTARTVVRVDRDGTYDGFSMAMGGRLSRNEIHVALEGENAECRLNGVTMMRGSEHCDVTTRIDHTAPHTRCSEMFRTVLDDAARGVFQGKIVVHKDAQQIEGHQLCNTLLLSDGAEMDAKPELEIYADDVKCSHGATTGQLDEDALFYLRSRGVPEALARNLLIQSFLGAVLENVADEGLRHALMHHVVHWLPARCYLSDEWRAA
jgi:Fe-S cluster assembly protein SufD